MKKILTLIPALLLSLTLFAQEAKPEAAPESPWKRGVLTQVGFSQLSLTNWAAGGSGSVSLNAYLDIYANYKKDKIIFNNELQLGYGFIQSFDDGYKKSDDRIIFDSKFGSRVSDKLYLSTVLGFRSQFADGYNSKNELVSGAFAPAYTTAGLGIDYQPANNFAINFAPVTGKLIMVADPALRSIYGNDEDQFTRFELGAQLKLDNKLEVKDFTVKSSLTLFSNYLDKPLNIKVNWDVNVDAKITRFFSVSLRTSLAYDDKVKSKKINVIGEDGTATTQMVQGIQFKELFTVGFSYLLGSKK